MHYVTLQPSNASARPPALIVLHGYGADERDLLSIAELVAPEFLTISLRAPIALQQGGFAWYHLTQTATGLHPDDLSRHESEDELVQNLAGILEREGADPERVVLMGFSQGAAMWHSLLTTYNLNNHGLTPRASINMSGYLPRDILAPLEQKSFAGFPFFISHGEFDDLIPALALEEATKLLTLRGANVTSKMYPAGHGVLPETMADIRAWLTKLAV